MWGYRTKLRVVAPLGRAGPCHGLSVEAAVCLQEVYPGSVSRNRQPAYINQVTEHTRPADSSKRETCKRTGK